MIFSILQSEASVLCFSSRIAVLCIPVWVEDLGVEEGQNWMISLVKKGTSQTDQEGLVNPACTPGRTLEGKVWPGELCSSEGNTSLCWVV